MNYHGVPIVVSDLDGDGDNEVISITKDFVLQVISPELFADASREVYTPDVKKSVRLSRFNIQKVLCVYWGVLLHQFCVVYFSHVIIIYFRISCVGKGSCGTIHGLH